MTSTVASAIRPSLRETRPLSSSPHTPSRFISSNYSSPGSTFRQEEDAVVIELGARYLRAGFEGESHPYCVIAFGPEHAARVGDYRIWAPGYSKRPEKGSQWGHEFELWRNDLKDVDLGLLEDKLERCIREAYNDYLLTDAGTARLVLVLPSLLPHPILSSILSLLFERWAFPSITLLPGPTMAAVAAGLRSALVVDIGWEETIVTPIYEYRELTALRTTRAMKFLTEKMWNVLQRIRKDSPHESSLLPVTFEMVEEVLFRTTVSTQYTAEELSELSARAEELSLETAARPSTETNIPRPMIEIDWPTARSSVAVEVSASSISDCVVSTFLDCARSRHDLDDHEQSPSELIYQALRSIPPDVRATCMERLIFVGGGSAIPDLSHKVVEQVQSLLFKYAWDRVRGQKVETQRNKLTEIAHARTTPPDARYATILGPGEDYVEQKLQKQHAKDVHLQGQTGLRQVDSLGAWAGASLLASLKAKGFVEIEREKFLSQGLSGAHRDVEISVIPQRMSGFGLAAAKAHERSHWTLAGWG